MLEEEVGEDPLLAALHRAEDAAAQAFLAQSDALLALWDDSPRDARTGERPHAVAEAAMALGLHSQSVQHRLSLAEGLRDHPLLRTQLREGHLRVPHVLVALDETDGLGDPALAARVLDAVLLIDGRIGWPGTPGELRRALVRTAIRLDPAGAAERRQLKQQLRTCVRLRHRDSGLADWTATGPATSLLAADHLLELLSGPTGPDDARTHGQRQVDALVGALLHRAGAAVPLELELAMPTATTAVARHPGTDLPEPVRLRADLTPELLQLLSSAARDGDPAPQRDQPTPDGCAPARRETAPATRAHAGPAERPPVLRSRVVPRTASVTPARGAEPAPRPIAPAQRDAAGSRTADTSMAADSAGRATAGARRRDAGRQRPRQGVPELLEHGPVDPALLAELLTDSRGLPVGLGPLTIRRMCVDEHGQVIAVDDRARPLQQLLAPPRSRAGRAGRTSENPTGTTSPGTTSPGTTSPGTTSPGTTSPGTTSPGTDRGHLLRRLLDRLPQPPPTTTAQAPTAAQTRVLRARDRRCTFPGCSHASRRCESDHRVRHPDGPTALHNLHPQCKHHHRLKHDGFHPRRQADGTTVWTTPRGQIVTTRPW